MQVTLQAKILPPQTLKSYARRRWHTRSPWPCYLRLPPSTPRASLRDTHGLTVEHPRTLLYWALATPRRYKGITVGWQNLGRLLKTPRVFRNGNKHIVNQSLSLSKGVAESALGWAGTADTKRKLGDIPLTGAQSKAIQKRVNVPGLVQSRRVISTSYWLKKDQQDLCEDDASVPENRPEIRWAILELWPGRK